MLKYLVPKRFIPQIWPIFAEKAVFGHFCGTFMAMKELKMFDFLIKFGLSDLKLVDIGTKIIKIGPEMPIL